ncbi:MAG TPA: hypothetical protein PK777_08125 [Thermoguttaceae bacterium]|nr:hypothetical protein [Thermoguttaceae bacterium]HPP52899.1 hypothetical protein [Thermoguttaceae bacterium]
MPSEQEFLDRAVLLLVSGQPPESVRTILQEKMGLKAAQATAVVQKAEKKIFLAARYDRQKELGTAIARLHDLYRRATAIQDTKTALQVQRELNKLLDLYEQPASWVEGADANAEEEAARRYLVKLGLGDSRTGLPELCRRAAARILELEGQLEGQHNEAKRLRSAQTAGGGAE